MPLETVQIRVLDDQLVAGPVDDVVVRVFDATGTTFITQATTGTVTDGQVEFTLDGVADGTEYQLRFFIWGGAIPSPQRILVFSPPAASPTGTNTFQVEAALHTLPTTPNPRLCRCSGFLWAPDGRPLRGVDLHFLPKFKPALVGDGVVLGERVAARSDISGFVMVDLYRDGEYDVMLEARDEILRSICVPDRSSIRLGDLLYPVVASVAYAPSALTVVSGGTLSITATVMATNFRALAGSGVTDVLYSVDNPAVASITVLSDGIRIHGHVPGTTTLRAQRRDLSIVRSPDPGVAGGAVTITVT